METFTEPVEINGSSDDTQLTVQGYISQDSPLQSWKTNGNIELARITGDGRLQIGTFDDGEMVTDDALIEGHRAADDSSKPTRGLHLKGGITGTLSSIVSWVLHELTLSGMAGIAALHTALRIRLRNEAIGPMTAEAELRGADVEISNAGGTTGDPVTRVVGFRVGVVNEASGYITTAYGIKVEAANSGTISQAYAIHTDAGIVYFGDIVQAQMLLQNQHIAQQLYIPTNYQTTYTEELQIDTSGEVVVDGAIFVM